MMLRLALLCLAAGTLAQLAPPGCLPTSEPVPVGGETLELQLSAPQTVQGGEDVELTVSLVGSQEPEAASYRWYQTYGRRVALQNADQPTASFVAPLVAKDHTLRFRVDAQNARGAAASAEAAVTVVGDPGLAEQEEPGPGQQSGTGDQSGVSAGEGGGTEAGAEGEPPAAGLTTLTRVYLLTTKGKIVIQLLPDDAPKTVKNFRLYIDEGFYPGTIFHRVIPDFIIQGGGFEPGMKEKHAAHSPVENESDNGLKNLRGTVAMARQDDPDSARAQFFINLVDNPDLDYQDGQPGYTVFARVVEGMNVVDAIAQVETHTYKGYEDVPVENIVISRVGYEQ